MGAASSPAGAVDRRVVFCTILGSACARIAENRESERCLASEGRDGGQCGKIVKAGPRLSSTTHKWKDHAFRQTYTAFSCRKSPRVHVWQAKTDFRALSKHIPRAVHSIHYIADFLHSGCVLVSESTLVLHLLGGNLNYTTLRWRRHPAQDQLESSYQ